MNRLVRFLLITFTLGRIRWLMRLTWLWRFIVFLGVTSWLAKMLRQAAGLGKHPSAETDSAWADAMRYTPQPAPTAPATAAASHVAAAPTHAHRPATPSDTEVTESMSEVTGTAADGTIETITIHEVDADRATESIVRIEDDAGHVETVVTGVPAESIDLANLGESAEASAAAAVEEPEIVELDIIEIVGTSEPDEAANELHETTATEEPAESSSAAEPQPAKRKRAAKVEPTDESAEEPLEITDEDADPDVLLDPDWVRGDGSQDCPESHPVKAKASSMIYYVPESGHYDRTVPDVCFASDRDAEAAGYRPPRR